MLSDINMAAPVDNPEVVLGFVEENDSWRLTSQYFPSKVGGKPAWLSPKDVPDSESLKCRHCGKVCAFLAQVYCPLTELPTCFHRTVFLFCCRDPACHASTDSGAFVVLRSQLPRVNGFYGFQPPNEGGPPSGAVGPVTGQPVGGLCAVCGCRADKKCAKCHITCYCCREHQVIDWKAGHKRICGTTTAADGGGTKFLFPEFELVTEPEDYRPKDPQEGDKEEVEGEVPATGTTTGEGQGLSVEELEEMAKNESTEDRQFAKFKKRVDHEPDQVVRYQRRGCPLLISRHNQPKDDVIPHCDRCGSERRFEFQIMPQLLIHLGVDSVQTSIDWGTLIVYTCAMSCEEGSAYRPEFLWKQIVVDPAK